MERRRRRVELRALLEARDIGDLVALQRRRVRRTGSCRAPRYLVNKSGSVWHCWVAEGAARGAATMRIRWMARTILPPGSASIPGRSCSIPYARAVFFPPGFDRETAKLRGSNAGRAPLGVLGASRRPPADLGPLPPAARVGHRRLRDARPRIHEAGQFRGGRGSPRHVRGRRRQDPVPAGPRGDRRGVAARPPARPPGAELLGVHAAELLRAARAVRGGGHARRSDCRDAAHGAGAARRRHRGRPRRRLQPHRGGGRNRPDVLLSGIDNSTYYLLHDDRRRYRNDTGTGNVLRAANPAVRRLVVDSLRCWAREMCVDGFRFDLASILTRRSDGSVDVEDPPAIAAIGSDPDLADLRLIAEPWDLGSYQLGRRFPGAHWSSGTTDTAMRCGRSSGAITERWRT